MKIIFVYFNTKTKNNKFLVTDSINLRVCHNSLTFMYNLYHTTHANIRGMTAVNDFCLSFFAQSTPCKHPVIVLQDVVFDDLQALVEFIYHGEVNVHQRNLSSFLKTAEVLRVSGLTQPSDSTTTNDVSINNCILYIYRIIWYYVLKYNISDTTHLSESKFFIFIFPETYFKSFVFLNQFIVYLWYDYNY